MPPIHGSLFLQTNKPHHWPFQLIYIYINSKELLSINAHILDIEAWYIMKNKQEARPAHLVASYRHDRSILEP